MHLIHVAGFHIVVGGVGNVVSAILGGVGCLSHRIDSFLDILSNIVAKSPQCTLST